MTITTWWRGNGRRRAVDRIPLLTRERDLLLALAWWQASELTTTRRQLTKADGQNVEMACELDGLRIQHRDTLDAYDELANRYRELDAAVNRLRALISTKSGMRPDDAEETVETPISSAWLAYPPNRQQIAA